MAKGIRDFVREARARIREVTPADLEASLEDPALLIVDVREPSEWQGGVIPGALCVPRGILEAAADPDYAHPVERLASARSRRVVLYCATGGRSALAAATLKDMGFADVASLAGGFDLWSADDRPTVAVEDDTAD